MKRPMMSFLLITLVADALLSGVSKDGVTSTKQTSRSPISLLGPRARKKILLSVLFFAVIISMLTAVTYTATYTPESTLCFQRSPGVFTHPTVYGTKLGRLKIVANGPMYNPTILITGITGGYDVIIIGPVSWEDPEIFPSPDLIPWEYTKEVMMNVLAVSYPNGLNGGVAIRAIKDKQPLLGGWSNEQVTTSPFYVDIYLVNSNDYGFTTNPGLPANLNTTGAFFKAAPFTFKHPFDPYFTVGVTNTVTEGPWVFPETGNPTQGQFIPIDGVSGQGTTPVVVPTGYIEPEDDDEGFWHEEGEISFLFSFQNNTVHFDLSEAYGNNKKTINVAQMNVLNGVAGTTYKQKLTFTDSGTTQSFQLKPDGVSGNAIDFNLYFGGSSDPIPYGQAFEWTGLVPNMNYKELKIGQISPEQVNQRLSGAYCDTITVNITAAP